jgi:transaldolase
MAAGEIGCHSATLSHQVLTELSRLRYDSAGQPGEGHPKPIHPYKDAASIPLRLQKIQQLDPLADPTWDGQLASVEIDYLANGGAELDNANEADPETKRRLSEALANFVAAEKRSQDKILGEMTEV